MAIAAQNPTYEVHMPADIIALLNDRFRRGDPTVSGKSFVTAGIIQLLTEQNIPICWCKFGVWLLARRYARFIFMAMG